MARPKPMSPAGTKVVFHKNRRGITYYLHEGKTKTGKPRYFFAKTVGEGALTKVPDGFEVSESINAIVSLRREAASRTSVPLTDVGVVESAIGAHPHLYGYVVRVVGNAIVIFEPRHRPAKLRRLVGRLGANSRGANFGSEQLKNVKFDPVMKFEPDGTGYTVFRMTYRGEGGWSWPLKSGKLPDVSEEFVKAIGTQAFFELA